MDGIISKLINTITNEIGKYNKKMYSNTEMNDLCNGIVNSIEKLHLQSYHVATALYDGDKCINVVKTFMYDDSQYRFNYKINESALIENSK